MTWIDRRENGGNGGVGSERWSVWGVRDGVCGE